MGLGVKDGGSLGVKDAGEDGGGSGSSGVTDHGALTGLTDDDHVGYLLIDGSRNMTGKLVLADTGFGFATQPPTGWKLAGVNNMQADVGGTGRLMVGVTVDMLNSIPLRSSAAGTSALGASGQGWGNVYVDQTKRVHLDDDADSFLVADADDVIDVYTGAAKRLSIGTAIECSVDLDPATDSARYFGSSSKRWLRASCDVFNAQIESLDLTTGDKTASNGVGILLVTGDATNELTLATGAAAGDMVDVMEDGGSSGMIISDSAETHNASSGARFIFDGVSWKLIAIFETSP